MAFEDEGLSHNLSNTTIFYHDVRDEFLSQNAEFDVHLTSTSKNV